MKYVFTILLLLMQFISSSQVTTVVKWQDAPTDENSDTIYYSRARKLGWNDFQGLPQANSPAAAITASGFGYSMSLRSTNGKTQITITVYCFFEKTRSWVKDGLASNYALLHEQHHFDITYINTCLFVRKLKEAAFTLSNFKKLLREIDESSNRDLEKMQNDYDGQTKNGQLKNVQLQWNKHVDEMLKAVVTD